MGSEQYVGVKDASAPTTQEALWCQLPEWSVSHVGCNSPREQREHKAPQLAGTSSHGDGNILHQQAQAAHFCLPVDGHKCQKRLRARRPQSVSESLRFLEITQGPRVPLVP